MSRSSPTGRVLLGGNLTLLALSHAGPENPSRTVPGADGSRRDLNDIVVTYRATPKLSFTTELNLIRDDHSRRTRSAPRSLPHTRSPTR